MAGSVLSAGMDDLLPEPIDRLCRNPIVCHLCHQVYKEPCLLMCFHSFCAKCLHARVLDGAIACPVCNNVTVMKDGNSVPPTDVLLRHLVEFSSEARTSCANCETVVNMNMYYCKTCGQALCQVCKDDTHRARMFSAHDVVPLSERLRKTCKQCPTHNEPYIMFNADRKDLLCIKCFRQCTGDSKLHCVDLDTAYAESVRRLERTVLSIRELQNSVRDGIILYRALLDEVHHNMDAEKMSISTCCRQLHETVAQLQERLLADVDGQYNHKNSIFERQLCDLCSLLPVLHVHLNMCTVFTRAANKMEFLDLSYSLMSRLSQIAHISVPLRPSQTSQVKTNFRRELCQALEPLLLPSVSGGVTPESGGRPATPRRTPSACRLHLLEAAGPFSDTCREIETRLQEATTRYRQLREMSPRRAEQACQMVESEVVSLACEVEEARNRLQHRWDEVNSRLHMERDVFSLQVVDLQQLSGDLSRFSLAIDQQNTERDQLFPASADNPRKNRPDVPPRVDSLPVHDESLPASMQSLADCTDLFFSNSQKEPPSFTTQKPNWTQDTGSTGGGSLLESIQAHGEELLRVFRQPRARPLQRWRVRSEERWREERGSQLSKLTWSGRGDGPPVAASSREAFSPPASDGRLSYQSSASWPRRKPPVLTPLQPDDEPGSATSADSERHGAVGADGRRGRPAPPVRTRRLRARGRGAGRAAQTADNASSPTDDEQRLAFSDSESKRRVRRAGGAVGIRRLKSADSCDQRHLLAVRSAEAMAAGVRRADSFEGHEQTVQTIVAAVHETRDGRRRNN